MPQRVSNWILFIFLSFVLVLFNYLFYIADFPGADADLKFESKMKYLIPIGGGSAIFLLYFSDSKPWHICLALFSFILNNLTILLVNKKNFLFFLTSSLAFFGFLGLFDFLIWFLFKEKVDLTKEKKPIFLLYCSYCYIWLFPSLEYPFLRHTLEALTSLCITLEFFHFFCRFRENPPNESKKEGGEGRNQWIGKLEDKENRAKGCSSFSFAAPFHSHLQKSLFHLS